MKKLLIDIVYCITILGFVGGGCYNILSVRPDMVSKLPSCIRSGYLFMESIVESPNVEVHDNTSAEKTLEEAKDTHIHDWQPNTIAVWESNGDGQGRVVFKAIYKCGCGKEIEE